jgi:hypothetical protein
MLNKIKCFLGIHAWEFIGVFEPDHAHYRRCEFCSKVEKLLATDETAIWVSSELPKKEPEQVYENYR